MTSNLSATSLKRAVRISIAALAACTASAITLDSSYLLGHVVPGSPSDTDIEEDRLDYLVEKYNGNNPAAPDGNTYTLDNGSNVPAPTLPNWDGTSTGQLGGGFTTATIDLGTGGWDYLMVKWANDSYYYYVGGLTGEHDIVNDVVFNTKGKAQNASHYRFFNLNTGTSVPDTGLALAMRGLGVAGIAFVRRQA